MASYQIDDQVVNAYRRHYPDDASLVAALVWASFAAARRVAVATAVVAALPDESPAEDRVVQVRMPIEKKECIV